MAGWRKNHRPSHFLDDKSMSIKCPLCLEPAKSFCRMTKEYFQCKRCGSLFLSPQHYLSLEDEKIRYLKHNNDLNDVRYQAFVQPIVDVAAKYFNKDALGLDFGCGTGPVISKLLTERGYNIRQYDPLFANQPDCLEEKYDYIICCEVIEHFHNPEKEFKLLRSMLKPGGKLICRTEMYSPELDFNNWHYKNDPTHVFFYQEITFAWISANFQFASLAIEGKLAILTA